MSHATEAGVLRIGELSRRVGVSEHVLRAWETRYGLPTPARSVGGYRLYSEDDEHRVRRMLAYLADGLAAAQAASAAMAEAAPGIVVVPSQADLVNAVATLARNLDEMDEPGAQAVLDRLLTDLTVETVLREVVMTYLHELGARWEAGSVSVAQEHFASHVIRGRLTGLARGWGNGNGPQALLACPPDELHDLALLVFGIVLNRRGWRVSYLGANTPMPDAITEATRTRPSLVVLAATTADRFEAVAPELAELAGIAPVVLAGEGATGELAQRIGVRILRGDPVTAAEHFMASLS